MHAALFVAGLLLLQPAQADSGDVLQPEPPPPAAVQPAPVPDPGPAPRGDDELVGDPETDADADAPAHEDTADQDAGEDPPSWRQDAWGRVGREGAAGTVVGLSAALAGLLLEVMVVSVPVLALSAFVALIVVIIVLAIVGIFGSTAGVDTGSIFLQVTGVMFAAIMIILSPLLMLAVPVLDALAFTATVGGLAVWQRREDMAKKKKARLLGWGRSAAHAGLAALASIPVAVFSLATFAAGGALVLLALNPDLLARLRVPTWAADPAQPFGPLFFTGLAAVPVGIVLGLGGALLLRPAAYVLMAGGLDTVAWPEHNP